jgi:hydrogenase maturation factor
VTVPDDLTACDPATGPCHLCGDVGTVGRVVAVDDATRTASVLLAGAAAPVTVALDLADARAGDDLLVHLGFAIERLEREGRT